MFCYSGWLSDEAVYQRHWAGKVYHQLLMMSAPCVALSVMGCYVWPESGCCKGPTWRLLPRPVQAAPGSALPHIHGARSGGAEELHPQRQVSVKLGLWYSVSAHQMTNCFRSKDVFSPLVPFSCWMTSYPEPFHEHPACRSLFTFILLMIHGFLVSWSVMTAGSIKYK